MDRDSDSHRCSFVMATARVIASIQKVPGRQRDSSDRHRPSVLVEYRYPGLKVVTAILNCTCRE